MTGRRVPARPRASRPRTRDGRRGMTLVELLMALVVLSIGVLSIAALFPVGSKTSIDQSRLTQATDLAQQRMEQLRTKTYSDPDLDPGLHPSSPGEWVGPNNSYLRWWTVTQLTGTLSDVKLVDIRVTWTALKPDTARLVTYFKR